MDVKAAVIRAPREAMQIETIRLDSPRDDEVVVKIMATGICLSDIHVMSGAWTVPLPAVLGHEGAGIVEEVGKGVSHVKPGDHVALSWAPECGCCRFCITGKPHLCKEAAPKVLHGTLLDDTCRMHDHNEQEIKHYSFLSTWAGYSVVPAASCIPINKEVPFQPASLVGCAVMTGIGAAINTAKIKPGSTVVIYGMGGVGLNIIQGAKLCGANHIVAIDSNSEKEQTAYTFGATHFVNPRQAFVKEFVSDLTQGFGADYVFEAVGHPQLMTEAFQIGASASTIVYIGIVSDGVNLELPGSKVAKEEKIITGSFYGSANPKLDFNKIIDFYQAGKIKLDELISDVIPLSEINQGCEKVQNKEAIRIVVEPHA